MEIKAMHPRYGKKMTFRHMGDVTEVRLEKFVNFEHRRDDTWFEQSITLEDKKEALAQFLKLHDRWVKGEVKDIGCQVREEAGKPKFMYLIWAE